MTTEADIEQLCARAAALVREAYRRGENDAIERMVKAARSGASAPVEAPTPPDNATVATRGNGGQERKRRAPKGAVGALVDRVLAETHGPTPTDIKDRATDETERQIAASSIRAHLRTGRERGIYVERGGRWYRKEEEAANPAGGRAASDLWSNQEDHR